MADANKYTTIAAHGESLFRDRGSKFLAFAYPVANADDIKQRLQALRKLHPKANHHVYAWRLGNDGNNYRAVDDGEPAGSSGRPVLGQIDSSALTNILIVVVRYFGGTLLGVPGLINAYKNAAAMALQGLPRQEKWIEERFRFSFDYPSMGEVLHILKGAEATIYRQDLQLFCIVEAGIPKPVAAATVTRLSELRGLTVEGMGN